MGDGEAHVGDYSRSPSDEELEAHGGGRDRSRRRDDHAAHSSRHHLYHRERRSQDQSDVGVEEEGEEGEEGEVEWVHSGPRTRTVPRARASRHSALPAHSSTSSATAHHLELAERLRAELDSFTSHLDQVRDRVAASASLVDLH